MSVVSVHRLHEGFNIAPRLAAGMIFDRRPLPLSPSLRRCRRSRALPSGLQSDSSDPPRWHLASLAGSSPSVFSGRAREY